MPMLARGSVLVPPQVSYSVHGPNNRYLPSTPDPMTLIRGDTGSALQSLLYRPASTHRVILNHCAIPA